MNVGCCSLARRNRSAIIGSLLSATVLILSCGPLSAQQLLPTGTPIAPAPADPAIAAALQQVSPGQHSRHHRQARSPSTIAARSPAWTPTCHPALESAPPPTGSSREFKRISAACGGCLEVKRDDFIEPPQLRPRRPHHQAHARSPTSTPCCAAPTPPRPPAESWSPATTTLATPLNANTHDAAPGANDDASGVAVSLECARVLSKLEVPQHHRLRRGCRRRTGP